MGNNKVGYVSTHETSKEGKVVEKTKRTGYGEFAGIRDEEENQDEVLWIKIVGCGREGSTPSSFVRSWDVPLLLLLLLHS